MILPEAFVTLLKKAGFRSFTGVPCSFFQSAVNCVIADPELSYTMVPNEGSALALASGAVIAGRPTAVLIQNSGLGNLINPLTSLNMIYGIPVLLFVSGRAYGVADEPQHEIIGRTMAGLLEAMGVAHRDLPTTVEGMAAALDEARTYMDTHRQPFVFLVRQDTVGSFAAPPASSRYPMKRIDAIRLVAKALGGQELVVATTGKPSRELFSVADRKENFYMQGSMGHAASIGLGVALARPDKKVVVLDGDGAILMHLGILSSVGHYGPKNFYHLVLDNEAYETTGDQDTTSSTTDLVRTALACGYAAAVQVSTETELQKALAEHLGSEGPCFIRIKINRIPTDQIPRITSRHTSVQIAQNFKSAF